MGAVYLAQHVRMSNRKAALKVLSPELAGDPEFRERFIRESDLAGSLEHPNIVPVYDAGEADGVLYCVMRYVRGTDLGAVLDLEARLTTRAHVRDPGRGRPRARLRARARAAPSRREAREHHARVAPVARRRARAGVPHGLRPRQAPRIEHQAHANRPPRRDARLHRAGGVQGRGARRAGRRLLARLRAVRVPDGRGAVPGLDRCGRDVRPPPGTSAHGHRRTAGAAARDRPRRPAGDGEAPERPLLVGGRPGAGRSRRARRDRAGGRADRRRALAPAGPQDGSRTRTRSTRRSPPCRRRCASSR